MRGLTLVLFLLLAIPSAAATLPSDPGSEVPLYEPVGFDRGFANPTYWDGHQYCVNYQPGVPTVVTPTLGSFVHQAPGVAGLDLTFHFRMTPHADGSCPWLTFTLHTTLTTFPDHTFYDMPVGTACGHAYLSDSHSSGYDILAIGSGAEGCIPGIPAWGAAYAYVPSVHPSPYVACDPIATGLCLGVTQYPGASSCGDGSTDGAMYGPLFSASRSCDGTAPSSWQFGTVFVTAYGNANGCTIWAAITSVPCAAAVGTAMETIPWGHVLP